MTINLGEGFRTSISMVVNSAASGYDPTVNTIFYGPLG
jgi:hypothetical protein